MSNIGTWQLLIHTSKRTFSGTIHPYHHHNATPNVRLSLSPYYHSPIARALKVACFSSILTHWPAIGKCCLLGQALPKKALSPHCYKSDISGGNAPILSIWLLMSVIDFFSAQFNPLRGGGWEELLKMSDDGYSHATMSSGLLVFLCFFRQSGEKIVTTSFTSTILCRRFILIAVNMPQAAILTTTAIEIQSLIGSSWL